MRPSDYHAAPSSTPQSEEHRRSRLPESVSRAVNGGEGTYFSVTNASGAIILPNPAATPARRPPNVDLRGHEITPSNERLPPIVNQSQHINIAPGPQHFTPPTSQENMTSQSLTQSQAYQEFLQASSRDDARRLLRELVAHPPSSTSPTSTGPPYHHVGVPMDETATSTPRAQQRTFESRAFPGGSAAESRRGEDGLGVYVMPKMRPRPTRSWKWREDKLQSVAQNNQTPEPSTSDNRNSLEDTDGDTRKSAKTRTGARYKPRMMDPLRPQDFEESPPKE